MLWWIVGAAVLLALLVVLVLSPPFSPRRAPRQAPTGTTVGRIFPPTPTPTIIESPLQEPAPGGLRANLVVTDAQFQPNDLLFGPGGRGIVITMENRNYESIEIRVRGTLYDGRQLVQKITSDPLPIDARETVLIPLRARSNVGVTEFEIQIVSVRRR